MRIKKGDLVEVLAGKDKGKQANVLRVLPANNRAIVEGVNIIKKHVKPNPQKNEKGGIKSMEASINCSNLMHVNPTSKKKEKVRIRLNEDGKKVRYFKSDETVLES